MAVDTILRYPNASSWHRTILSLSNLKRLFFGTSRRCFSRFTDGIIEKLVEAKKATPAPDAELSGPIVSISTVKMLAQLLRGT